VPKADGSGDVSGVSTALETWWSDDGFASVDPERSLRHIAPSTLDNRFIKSGPADYGSSFTFSLGELATGASVRCLVYGACSSEASADEAIKAAGMEFWSIGFNSVGNAEFGPAVFFFGFAGVGGTRAQDADSDGVADALDNFVNTVSRRTATAME
jgi:hypothetical protein